MLVIPLHISSFASHTSHALTGGSALHVPAQACQLSFLAAEAGAFDGHFVYGWERERCHADSARPMPWFFGLSALGCLHPMMGHVLFIYLLASVIFTCLPTRGAE